MHVPEKYSTTMLLGPFTSVTYITGQMYMRISGAITLLRIFCAILNGALAHILRRRNHSVMKPGSAC